MTGYSRLKVIQELKRLDRLEVDLSADHISKVDPPLYQAAKAYFPEWQEALVAAGKGYKTVRN